MPARIVVVLLALILISAPALSEDSPKLSVFLNPYKYFLGLFNIGLELQCGSNVSLCVSAECTAVRSGHLRRIRHPDFVMTVGLRYYGATGDLLVSGLYAGAACGCWYSRRSEVGNDEMDFALGAEAGYRLFVDDSFYLVPRGLVNRTMRGKKLLLGAELLMGAIP